jgi:putative ABC transport system permease protein
MKMLLGDRAKYLAIIMGISFASLLITHQEGIFCGFMSRTITAITDLGLPDIWVMDPKVQFIDDIKPMQDTQLTRVRGIEEVDWAVPLYKGMLKARLDNGSFQTCHVLGLDDATLIGGPPVMVKGQIADLRQAESIIVDEIGAKGKLARHMSDGSTVPLKVGDTMELNDHRATVVGICKVGRNFQSQPVVYTTYSRAVTFAPHERKLLSFVLVGVKPGQDPHHAAERIQRITGLAARTRDDFKWLTMRYYLKYTGVPINIGIGMLMSFIVGTAISGQTFYSFTLDNMRHFGALKAMGASNQRLLGMIALQAAVVGLIGFGLGVGASATVGQLFHDSEMVFLLLPQALIITGCTVVLICFLASILSIRKVMMLEPAIVFKS